MDHRQYAGRKPRKGLTAGRGKKPMLTMSNGADVIYDRKCREQQAGRCSEGHQKATLSVPVLITGDREPMLLEKAVGTLKERLSSERPEGDAATRSARRLEVPAKVHNTGSGADAGLTMSEDAVGFHERKQRE